MRPRMRRWAAAGVLVVALPLMADACDEPVNSIVFKSVNFFVDAESRGVDQKAVIPLDTESQEGEYGVSAGRAGTFQIVFGTQSGYDTCTLDLDGRTTVAPRYVGNGEYVVAKHLGALVKGRTVNGSLRCVDNEGFAVPTISYFSVKGVGGPLPVLSPAVIEFGAQQVGTKSSHRATVTLTNKGTMWFQTQYPQSDNSDVIDIQGGCNVETVKPGDFCRFTIGVTLDRPGSFVGHVGIHVVGYGSQPDAVEIRATGVGSPAVLTTSPTTVDFGKVNAGSSEARTLTLTNVGSSPLRVDGISWKGSTNISITSSTCTGQVLPGSGTCFVVLTFAPSSAGLASGQITVVGSMVGSPRTIDVSGTGISLEPTPQPTYTPPTPP